MNVSVKPMCCHKPMGRNYQVDLANVGNKEYAKPLHSDSLAISPSQRAEHQKLFPDIKLDDQCRPVFENYRQHDSYLEKTGFVKLKQRKKRRTKKLK